MSTYLGPKPSTMKALLLDKTLTLRDLPKPSPAQNEALIRVNLAGICSTDLQLLAGYAGFRGVPGHEFVGEVMWADSAPDLVGERVVGEINVSCMSCACCNAGMPNHCMNRTALGISGRNGAFAQLLTLPIANLHRVPEGITDRKAVFIEPLAASCVILQQVAVRPEDRVAVLGDGKLGLLISQVLQLIGCDLTVIGHHRSHLEILEERGIKTSTSIEKGLMDIVVDATGIPEGIAIAKRLLRPRGILVMKSTYQGRLEVDMSRFVVDEITLVGSRCGPFAPAIRLLEQGLLEVERLIEATYPLSKGLQAFEHAARPGALKVLIDCV